MPDGVIIPGGPSFAGNPQPPDVPCDPTGEAWRGEPGPPGPQGAAGGLAGGTMTGPLNWTSTGSTTSRSAQDRTAESVNVKDFGAAGNGTTDDTAAIQAAANAIPASGSTLLFPPGIYAVSTAIRIPSNTRVQGQGATLLALPGFPATGALLTNQHNTATVLTDHDIIVHNITLDFGASGVAGAAHAMRLVCVRNAAAIGCVFQCRGGGNATAFIGCYNTLIEGCTAYGFINCGYDHWQSPSYARVIGCHAESASSAQIVNFNPEGVSGAAAKGFVLAGCTLVSTAATAIACQIEPLAGGTTVQDVTIIGNTFVNSYLSMRRAITGVLVSGNVFDSVAGGVEAIRAYTQDGGSPVNVTIIGNTIINPATVLANVSVIRIYTSSATIIGNVVTGTLVGGVSAIDIGSFSPVVLGNSLSGGIAGTAGATPGNFSTLRVTGNAGFNNTAPIAKPTVSGAKGSNAALASLLTALAAYGLVTDTTTA